VASLSGRTEMMVYWTATTEVILIDSMVRCSVRHETASCVMIFHSLVEIVIEIEANMAV
jgi:hypothetical protein